MNFNFSVKLYLVGSVIMIEENLDAILYVRFAFSIISFILLIYYEYEF